MFKLSILLVGLNSLRRRENAFYPLYQDTSPVKHIPGVLGQMIVQAVKVDLLEGCLEQIEATDQVLVESRFRPRTPPRCHLIAGLPGDMT